jgi:hypothetical protein
MHAYACIHTCIHTYAYIHIWTRIIYASNEQTHAHTHTCTHTHTHTHTHIRSLPFTDVTSNSLQASIIGSVPSIAVYFGVYQFLKRQLTVMVGLNIGISISAAFANLLAALVRVPFEIIKQRLQAGVYKDTFSAVRQMHAAGGLHAFLPVEAIKGQVRNVVQSLADPLFGANKRHCLFSHSNLTSLNNRCCATSHMQS